MYQGLQGCEQRGDGKTLCYAIVGTRCPLSLGWTSSQLLDPLLSRVIKCQLRGLCLSLLCAVMQDCSRDRVTDVLQSVV